MHSRWIQLRRATVGDASNQPSQGTKAVILYEKERHADLVLETHVKVNPLKKGKHSLCLSVCCNYWNSIPTPISFWHSAIKTNSNLIRQNYALFQTWVRFRIPFHNIITIIIHVLITELESNSRNSNTLVSIHLHYTWFLFYSGWWNGPAFIRKILHMGMFK